VLTHEDFSQLRFDTRWLENKLVMPAAPPQGDEDASVNDPDPGALRDEVWVGGRRYIIPFFGAGAAAASSTPQADPTRPRREGGSAPRVPKRPVAGGGTVTSPMQGTVVKVAVSEGQDVAVGEVLFVVEAMKMENPVRANVAGRAVEISVTEGATVTAGTQLARIEVSP
jgi:acetyl-CoA/propionyl-CoA carboxylase biotin carboxyl carrier protein